MKPVEHYKQYKVDFSGLTDNMFLVKNLMSLNLHGFGLHILSTTVFRNIKDYTSILRTDEQVFEDDNKLQNLFEVLQLIRDTKFNYKLWLNSEYQMYLDTFKEFKYIKDEMLYPNFLKPSNVISARIHAGFKVDGNIMQLRKGEEITEPLFNKPIYLYPKIIMSDNVNEWFDFQENFSFKTEDKLVASLFMRIDTVEIDFSQFFILISYKGNVFMIKIGHEPASPFGRKVQADRYNNKKYRHSSEEIPFSRDSGNSVPWFLIDDVNRKRRESGNVKDNRWKGEYYFEEWDNIHPSYPFYFYHFVRFTLESIDQYKGEYKRAVTIKRFINDPRLLIGSKEDGSIRSDDLANSEYVDEFYNDMVQSYLNSANNNYSIMKVSKDLIKQDKDYDENWVGSVENIEKLSRWHILNKHKDSVKGVMEGLFSPRNIDTYRNQMSDLINSKFDHILNLCFEYDSIVTLKKDVSFGSRIVGDYDDYSNYKILKTQFNKPDFYGTWNSYNVDKPSVAKANRIVRMNRNNSEVRCQICNNVNSSNFVFSLRAESWKDLCFILDCNREDLPILYRTYHSNSLTPYSGNSILNMLNPIHDIKDPANRMHNDYVAINLRMCVKCSKSMRVGNHLLLDMNLKRIKHKNNPNEKTSGLIPIVKQ